MTASQHNKENFSAVLSKMVRSVSLTKGSLRTKMRKTLDEYYTHNRALWDKRCQDLSANLWRFLGAELHQPTIVIGAYVPLRSEADWTFSFLKELEGKMELVLQSEQKCQIMWAFPRAIDGEGRTMEFAECQWSELLSDFQFGIKLKIPPATAKTILPQIIIVPGLAFTPKGGRLGRGKGFYDRYLDLHKNVVKLKVGVCLEEQMEDALPINEHDQIMDFVVTDQRIMSRDK